MKYKNNAVAIVALLLVSLVFSSCFGRMQRAAVRNDNIKKQNGTYHRKHYHGNHQWY